MSLFELTYAAAAIIHILLTYIILSPHDIADLLLKKRDTLPFREADADIIYAR